MAKKTKAKAAKAVKAKKASGGAASTKADSVVEPQQLDDVLDDVKAAKVKKASGKKAKTTKKAAKKASKTAKKASKTVKKAAKATSATAKKAVKKTAAKKKIARKTAKKTVVAPEPVKPYDIPATTLTKKELAEFREMLLEKRRTLLGDMTGMAAEAMRSNSSDNDHSTMPVHMADIGTDNYEQEFTLGLLESERQLLREIDESLGQIVEGHYGVCMGTGEPIGTARLRAKPWAKYSIAYVRKIEQGLVKVPARDYGEALAEEQDDDDDDE